MIDRTAHRGVQLEPRMPLAEQPGKGHNRWHPELEPALHVAPGETFYLDLIDASDTAVSASNPAGPWEHSRIHPLTGPVAIDGVRAGDVVEVRILDVETGPIGITSARPGQGLIGDRVTHELYAIWQLSRDEARSDELPNIVVPARSFPGCLGVAPSAEFVRVQRTQERILGGRGAVVAQEYAPNAVPEHALTGLRTMPPRENGGNMDVPQLTRGSRAFFTAQVDGALISAGDLHFAQGEGEMGGSAIETNGAVLLQAHVHPAGALRPTNPLIGWHDQGRGLSITATGQASADSGVADLGAAARAAAGNLATMVADVAGLGPEQTSILLSVAADLSFAQLVNHPYPTAMARLPLSVFAAHPSRTRWAALFG